MCDADANLVACAQDGDAQAFIELIRLHEQPLLAVIRRYVPDVHHREDSLQTTLLQAWRDIGRLRDSARFKAWLLRIARNRCRDFAKSPGRRERPADNEALDTHLSRFGRTVRNETPSTEVHEAIGRLGPAQRRIMELFYLQGLTIAEISRRVACPEGTVKSRLYHARRVIRHHFRCEPGE